MEGRILALDLATKTGLAIGSRSEGVVNHASVDLARNGIGGEGAIFRRLIALIERLNTDCGQRFAAVVFEMPVLPRSTNIKTLRRLYGLAAVCELACARLGVPVYEVETARVRQHFLPSAAHGRKAIKSAIVTECRARGWDPIDDNAADALAILDFALEHFNPGYSPPVWALRPRGMNNARAA